MLTMIPSFERAWLFNCQDDFISGYLQWVSIPISWKLRHHYPFKLCLKGVVYTTSLGVLAKPVPLSASPHSSAFRDSPQWQQNQLRLFTRQRPKNIHWVTQPSLRKTHNGSRFSVLSSSPGRRNSLLCSEFSNHCCYFNLTIPGWFHNKPDCLLILRMKSHIW